MGETISAAWDAVQETMLTPHLFMVFCVGLVIGGFLGWLTRQ
jgi:hypothetical protein